MKYSALLLTCITLMLSAPNLALAQETNTRTSAKSNPLLSWFASDIYRLSVGIGQAKLQNPKGFDVPIDTHNNGRSENAVVNTFITVVGERAIGWERRQKRLWNLHYDANDFDGLSLSSLTFGAGIAIDPASTNVFGGRLAIGANLGITRSETFFDSTVHPAAELWVSAGVQLTNTIDRRFVFS